MTHEVEAREIEPRATAGIRATTSPEELGQVLGQNLPGIWDYLEERGVHPAGPPFARYHEYRGDRDELEAGLPVAEAVTGEGRISAGTFPSGKVAAHLARGALRHAVRRLRGAGGLDRGLGPEAGGGALGSVLDGPRRDAGSRRVENGGDLADTLVAAARN